MTIKFLGHATFLITSEDGLRIMTDPYDPGGYGGQFRYRPITDAADIVTVSHDHADHNYPQGVPGSPVALTSSGEVRGISFEVIESYHDDAQGARRSGGIGHIVLSDRMAAEDVAVANVPMRHGPGGGYVPCLGPAGARRMSQR